MSTTITAGDAAAAATPPRAPAPAPRPAGPPVFAPLEGRERTLGTIALSLATFMNVLDSSIANVSIPAIS
ncbi:MAG: MFS transporter, partial [Rhodoferax sp.]|nr:MFS transporter [Rhodoferax sp.]